MRWHRLFGERWAGVEGEGVSYHEEKGQAMARIPWPQNAIGLRSEPMRRTRAVLGLT